MMSAQSAANQNGHSGRFRLLVEKFVDEDCTRAEALELKGILKTHERFQIRFAERLLMCVSIDRVLSTGALGENAAFPSGPPVRRLSAPAKIRSLRYVRWSSMAVAAGLLIVVGWFLVAPRQGGSVVEANLHETITGTILVRNGIETPAGKETVLGDGDRVRTPENSRSRMPYEPNAAKIRSVDGSLVASISTGAEIEFGLNEAQPKLRLIAGVMDAEVTKKLGSKGLIVDTPVARLLITGTDFTAAHLDDSTRLQVREGCVLISARQAGTSKPLKVSAGEYAVLTPSGKAWTRSSNPLEISLLLGRYVASGGTWTVTQTPEGPVVRQTDPAQQLNLDELPASTPTGDYFPPLDVFSRHAHRFVIIEPVLSEGCAAGSVRVLEPNNKRSMTGWGHNYRYGKWKDSSAAAQIVNGDILGIDIPQGSSDGWIRFNSSFRVEPETNTLHVGRLQWREKEPRPLSRTPAPFSAQVHPNLATIRRGPSMLTLLSASCAVEFRDLQFTSEPQVAKEAESNLLARLLALPQDAGIDYGRIDCAGQGRWKITSEPYGMLLTQEDHSAAGSGLYLSKRTMQPNSRYILYGEMRVYSESRQGEQLVAAGKPKSVRYYNTDRPIRSAWSPTISTGFTWSLRKRNKKSDTESQTASVVFKGEKDLKENGDRWVHVLFQLEPVGEKKLKCWGTFWSGAEPPPYWDTKTFTLQDRPDDYDLWLYIAAQDAAVQYRNLRLLIEPLDRK